MSIKYIQLPADADLKSYLKEAERAVDALTDDELEQAEADLEARINILVNPPISLFSHESKFKTQKSRAQKSQSRGWIGAGFGGLLMAAMALFFVRNSTLNEQDRWQTKGSSDFSATVCEATLFEGSDGEGTLITSNCPEGSSLILEKDIAADGNGSWQTVDHVRIENRIVVNEEGPVDVQKYPGARMRLRAEHGVSEEFSLTKTP